jgi:hypothetical protein
VKTLENFKISQPVIIRSFQDEFEVKHDFKMETPASQGDTFVPGELDDQMNLQNQKIYCSGVGKLLYFIQSITRELSRYFMSATLVHDKAMRRVMTSCLNTKD